MLFKNIVIATILLLALSVTFAYAVIQRGGVYRSDWLVVLAALSALWVLHPLATKRRALAKNFDAVCRLVLVFAVLAALQVIPLPAGVLALLSTARMELARSLDGAGWNTISIAPQATVENLLHLAGYLLTFFLVRELAWSFRARIWWVFLPLIGIGALEACLGITQFYILRAEHGMVFASGTYVNRNHFAGLLEMTLPLAVLCAIHFMRYDRGGSASRIMPALYASMSLIAAGLILLGIVHSLSKMGFLSALLTMFLVGVVAIRATADERSRWQRVLPIAILAVITISIFVFLPNDDMVGRLAEMASPGGGLSESRMQFWRDTAKLIAAYPVFGCGFGAYESGLMPYKTALPMLGLDYAHNDYLQIMAELGLVGFAVGMAIIVLLLRRILRIVNRSTDGYHWYAALSCMGVFLTMLFHSMVDFNLYIPANAMMLAWVAGAMTSLRGEQRG